MKRMLLPLSFLTALHVSPVTAKLINIQDEAQYSQELAANPNMIVEFSADWCSVCNGIRKPFEEIASEPEFQQVAFAQVDVDKMDGISKQNGIVGVPTFVYVENGQKKVEEIGVQNMPAFKDHLRQNLRKTFKIAQNNVPTEIVTDEEVTLDIQPSAAPPAEEPNAIVKFFNMIFSFIMMVVMKIKEFFMMIIDSIKGFFNK